ncbi:MAG: hypothetical protein ACE5F1_17010 [Planctomycetota bacterium]
MNLIGTSSRRLGKLYAKLQNGHIQSYALWMAGGATLFLAYVVVRIWGPGE